MNSYQRRKNRRFFSKLIKAHQNGRRGNWAYSRGGKKYDCEVFFGVDRISLLSKDRRSVVVTWTPSFPMQIRSLKFLEEYYGEDSELRFFPAFRLKNTDYVIIPGLLKGSIQWISLPLLRNASFDEVFNVLTSAQKKEIIWVFDILRG